MQGKRWRKVYEKEATVEEDRENMLEGVEMEDAEDWRRKGRKEPSTMEVK